MKKSGGRYTRYKVSYSWEGDCEMGENKMPHIQLPENLGIRYAVLPGDPARAERAAGYLKDAKLLTFNREYKSYSGFWNGVPVLSCPPEWVVRLWQLLWKNCKRSV